MQYWLLKSEPDAYSWSKLVTDGKGHWDGVRNFRAASNLRKMKVGDRAFFYHSNIGKEIVGVMEIAREPVGQVDARVDEPARRRGDALAPARLEREMVPFARAAERTGHDQRVAHARA